MTTMRPAEWPLPAKERIWRLSLFSLACGAAWMTRDLRWDVVWTTAPALLQGLGISFLLAVTSVAAGMIAGMILAVARTSGPFGLRHLAIGYIEIVRAVPQLMVIFWIFFTWPAVTGRGMSPWSAAFLSLTVIAAAYLAEVIRAGIESVPPIQKESAFVLGLSPFQAFMRVVLPQALRNMLPALIATFVMMFKVTSLVYVVGIVDFFRAVVIINNREFAPYALYTTLAVVYFACCWALSWLIRKLDPNYALTS